jgi:uncharacterized protein
MIRDALAGERLLALALLRPGWEREYHGSPPFHDLGCLARIESVEWLPDDCYDLKLLGLARVRLGAAAREFPYRAVRATVLPEAPYTEDDPLVTCERRELAALYRRLAERPDAEVAMPFGALVNGVCMTAPLEAEERLELLALDSVIERGHRVRELAARHLHDGGATEPGEHN